MDGDMGVGGRHTHIGAQTHTVILGPRGVLMDTSPLGHTAHILLHTDMGIFYMPRCSYPREPTELIHCSHTQLLTVPEIHSTSRPAVQHPAASASCKHRGQLPRPGGGEWNVEAEVRDL